MPRGYYASIPLHTVLCTQHLARFVQGLVYEDIKQLDDIVMFDSMQLIGFTLDVLSSTIPFQKHCVDLSNMFRLDFILVADSSVNHFFVTPALC